MSFLEQTAYNFNDFLKGVHAYFPAGVSGKNKLKPHERTPKESTAPGTHSTFKRDPKSGKITHYSTWKENTNSHPLDPNPNPFKKYKEYHGNGQEQEGHFMKQNQEYSGFPHVHRVKRNHKTGKNEEIIERPKLWEIPRG